MGRRLRRTVVFRCIAVALTGIAVLVALGVRTAVAPAAQGALPLTGFSYMPRAAEKAQLDDIVALDRLLDALDPDVVRLPVYWPEVEPHPGVFDFSSVDREVRAVEDYADRHPRRATQVILVVGERNLGYPELYVPTWEPQEADRVAADYAGSDGLGAYLAAAASHYRGLQSLLAWQVENEPLDTVTDLPPGAGDPSLRGVDVAGEISQVRAIDAAHPVVVTTYDSSTLDLDQLAIASPGAVDASVEGPKPAGHPQNALALGDILGLDAYVVTTSQDAVDAPVPTRIAWKAAELGFWNSRARAQQKDLWVMELQAAPFDGSFGFDVDDLVDSARAYRASGAGLALLWGDVTWLRSSTWLEAARSATAVLRGEQT